MKNTIYLLLIFCLVYTFGWSKDEKNTNVIIFFTNDTNGHPLSFKNDDDNGQGGIPARATLIKKILEGKKNITSLILDTGGIIKGRPESNLFNGEPDIVGMNTIGYIASGVGTSEISTSAKFFENLNSKANFYFLSSNILTKEGKPLCDKFFIKKINGVNIGIFSLISEDALNELSEQAQKDFRITDPIKVANEIVTELKSKKNACDIIIALTYMGYYHDNSIIGSRTLASSVNGIDIIIDGRTGIRLDQPEVINNTKICQAYKWGLFFGEIDLKIENKKIIDFQYSLHPVNYKINGNLVEDAVPEDDKVNTAIIKKMTNYEKILTKTIVKIQDGKFDSQNIRDKETELGDLICDAMIDYTNVNVAFQNAGGISSEVIDAKELNRKSLDNIIKYDNSIVVINMSGADIKKVLEYSMSSTGKGSFLQVGGIKFSYSKSTNSFKDIMVGEKELDDNNIYKIAINSWLSDGGDGYSIFSKVNNKINLNIIHREVVYDYLLKKGTYTPKIDGRITILD